MTIEKLIEAAKSMVVTSEDIRELEVRLAQAEKQFEEERLAKEKDPQGFLNRQYTI